MTTMDLINELRDQATVIEPGTLYHLLNESADRLEALDERVGIMRDSLDGIGRQLRISRAISCGLIAVCAVMAWAIIALLAGR